MIAKPPRVLDSYYLFYAVTYAGSTLTSISSFFMVEKLGGSLTVLGFALALKTGFVALASPGLARILANMPMRRGFWLSQLLGMVLIVPISLGLYLNSLPIFLAALAVGGIPNLILNMMSTTYLKLTAGPEIAEFRKNQGQLQLVISVCFALCAIAAPLILRWFSFQMVLFLDFLTYAAGALFIFRQRSFQNWEAKAVTLAEAPEHSSAKILSYLSWSTLAVAAAIFTSNILKGLPPLVAGNPQLTSFLSLDPTFRQSLWFFEALAGVAAGLVYRRFHKTLSDRRIFEAGMMNGLFLVFAVCGLAYAGLALALFLLSLAMTLTFMNLRDQFVAQHSRKEEILWASGLINLALNTTMTLSPLLIGLLVDRAGPSRAIGGLVAFQVFAFLAKKGLN